MKVLFFGDIYGRIGRKSFLRELPSLKEKYNSDIVVANIDNLTSGRGPVLSHIETLTKAGVDICTGGDHVFDNKDSISEYMSHHDTRLLRPANFPENSQYKVPGIGHKVFEIGWYKLLVIHLLGQVFINHKVENPFHVVDSILKKYEEQDIWWIVIDFHKEATAEVQALGLYLDGRVSFVGGTHTHVQTNDDRILPKGTGYITDLGMSGPYNSVIWATLESVTPRFLTWLQKWKIEQSLDPESIVSGVFFEIEDTSGKCVEVEKISIRSGI